MTTALQFKIVSAAEPLQAVAIYAPDEYSLLVAPPGAPIAGERRTSIDTLTLSFRRIDNALVGLDAYTNWTNWDRVELEPPPGHTGLLVCQEDFDVHGIARGLECRVRYSYSEARRCLRLVVGDAAVAVYAGVLSSVTAGLGRDGELVELWIRDLQIRTAGGVTR